MPQAKENRKSQIMNYLTKHKFVLAAELVKELNYSLSTIKRDLVELEQEEQIRRTRGGAMLIDKEKIDAIYLKKLSNHTDNNMKNEIAKKASLLIYDDMTIFLDSSSTTLHLIPYLKKFHGLRIVTNSVLTATLLSEHVACEVNIIGGMVARKKFMVNSATALNQLLMYHFDIAFISCRGYDSEYGATENSEGEAILKQNLVKCADKIVLMTLPEKRGKIYFFQSLSVNLIDVVI